MNFEILSIAEAELEEIVEYYNNQSEGLGYVFLAEFGEVVGRIIQYPKAWQSLSPRTRRCRFKHFPFGVNYQVRAETILIIAVMHLKRHPDSWKFRLPSKEG